MIGEAIGRISGTRIEPAICPAIILAMTMNVTDFYVKPIKLKKEKNEKL